YVQHKRPSALISMTSDLNPLQQVWDQLTQRLEDRTPPQNDLAELHAALVEEWNTFPQNNIMRLVRRMRCCCQAGDVPKAKQPFSIKMCTVNLVDEVENFCQIRTKNK
uniref:Tc1-like transposase DDE domain-containing protein n=1 Tax=Oryzias latipes TaxID=8090 RepID=A0A3P9LEX0_ORYLA